MIGHSGIGVVIRHLLREWFLGFRELPAELLGPEKLIRQEVPRGVSGVSIIPWAAPVYGPSGLLGTPPFKKAQVFFSPHYTAPLRLPIPLVATVQDLIHITHPPRGGTGVYMRMVLAALRKKAVFVLTPSRHTKVQLQTLYGFEPQRVHTFAYGPGLGNTRPGRSPMVEAFPEKFFLAVGLWKPHKNWEFLIERLGKLSQAGKPSLPLVAAGLNQESERLARECARRSGLDILFAPRLTDAEMARLYEKATALLFPSLAEGFGFPVLEAMAHGTPVMTADLPPMTDVASYAGLRYDPDSPDHFDKSVTTLLSDHEMRKQMVEAGKKRAAEFSWSRYTSGVVRTLRQAAA